MKGRWSHENIQQDCLHYLTWKNKTYKRKCFHRVACNYEGIWSHEIKEVIGWTEKIECWYISLVDKILIDITFFYI